MRLVPILLAILLSVSFTLAQPPQSQPMSPFEQELVNNENQFMQSLAEKNVAYVNQAVADDFKGIGTNGDFYDRDELVGMAHEGLPRDVRVYEVRVVRLNDDSGVVTYNLIIPGARPRYRHMSDTWAKEGGKWKLKFEQTTTNLWSATDFD